MKTMVKVWEKDETRANGGFYWTDEDGELLLYESIEHAKRVMRDEYKESFIEKGVEYHDHFKMDETGYDLK